MSRSLRTKHAPTGPGRLRGNSPRPALLTPRAVLPAALLCLALTASPALAATAPPELIAPIASSAHNSPLSVEYKLPEAGAPGAKLSFTPSVGPAVTVTLTSAAAAAGKHHFFLDLHQLENETANVSEASASSLADGEYTVTLSYQDVGLDPAANASVEKVTIKTLTAPPVVSKPTAGQEFRGEAFKVAYTLPEAALPGSAKLTLLGTHAGAKTLVLSETSAGSHTAEVIPSAPATGAGITSGPSERLPADSYQLSLSYQDALGNPAAITTAVAIAIAYPLCEAGSYSSSGEEPCVKAPKGYFVADKGAIVADECIAGRFGPTEGLSECLPAEPGHYVPATGAKEELECEQGPTATKLAAARASRRRPATMHPRAPCSRRPARREPTTRTPTPPRPNSASTSRRAGTPAKAPSNRSRAYPAPTPSPTAANRVCPHRSAATCHRSARPTRPRARPEPSPPSPNRSNA